VTPPAASTGRTVADALDAWLDTRAHRRCHQDRQPAVVLLDPQTVAAIEALWSVSEWW
jgi:hypothetical protein